MGAHRIEDVAIVGGGIAGMALALNLHARSVACAVYEVATDIREIGVGITLLPHAMRELTKLGLADEIAAQGIENTQSSFYTRFGQHILSEPRGKFAGYPYPEIGIHRGRLHGTLYRAVRARLGDGAVRTGARCVGVTQDDECVTLQLEDTASGEPLPPVRAAIAVACDGVNSVVRNTFYHGEQVVFSGVNTWRGVTRRPPILDGRTYLRVGSFLTGNIIVYPIIDNVDGSGDQLINWVAQRPAREAERNDWNKPADAEAFVSFFDDWVYDWLDVPALINGAGGIFEYPMVDKDPIPRWTFGRVTLAGDAAHPMYPRGSNGSAQALIDVRVLADELEREGDPRAALVRYEERRRPATTRVVEANRSTPPDFLNIRVQELTGDRPFENLDDFISAAELRKLSDQYKQTTGYSLDDMEIAATSPEAGR